MAKRSVPDGDGSGEVSEEKLRILIVEDEAMLAFGLEQDLLDAGYTTVGPARSLQAAQKAVVDESFHFAILDINLNGELAYPVADELARRGVPFIFVSGYGTESIPEEYRAFPRLSKPYDPAHLLRELERLV